MSGPWEKYANPAPPVGDGPWAKYAAQAAPAVEAPPADAGIRGARRGILAKIDAGVRGATDMLTFGFADEMAAGMDAALNPVFGTGKPGATFGERYDQNVEDQRAIDKADSENRFGSRLAGQGVGVVTGGLGLAKAGLSAGANALRSGASLPRVALGTAVDGGVAGGLSGAGAGETLEQRVEGAAMGSLLGIGVGGAAPFAVAGVQAVGKPLLAPLMARLRPDAYANSAVGEALKRSGKGADQVVEALAAARADGQGMFNIADAMGNAGQRMLSTAARVPHDARQEVVEALVQRQAGQGERLAATLADGFGAPDTAAQRAARLTAQRGAAADANYGAARASAGGVDPSSAIAAADDFLKPGAMAVMRNQTGIADDSIEAAVGRARSYLTDGQSVVSDFQSALRAKQEIDAMIEGAKPAVQKHLAPIRNALDDALAKASPDYSKARDTFRQQSRAIEAVDAGKSAASPRVRADDSVPAFSRMTADEQSAFRVGYADPVIARVEAASTSPTTNKARLLQTGKSEKEFPAFAEPGRFGLMDRRIRREQTMFDTANTALGGSKTADNLADAADMAQFDPGVIKNLLRGRPIDAAMDAISRLGSEAKGMPPRVVEKVARAMIESDPNAARQILESGAFKAAANDKVRAVVNALLVQSGAGATGRSVVP